MTTHPTSFRHWLPEGAIDGRVADRALEALVAAWSTHWLAEGGEWALRSPLVSRARLAPSLGGDWHVQQGGLAIRRGARLSEALASAMLGAGEGDGFARPADLQIAEALAAASLEDLLARLAGLFGLDGGWQRNMATSGEQEAGWLACGIGPEDGLIDLFVRPDLVIPLVKAGLPGAADGIRLGTLAQALDHQPVQVSGHVGACPITLAELDSLAPGDVLVVDRLLALPLDLTIDGRPTGRRCSVETVDGGLALELLETLTG